MMRENPFADYGGIVHGDRFIGRNIKAIELQAGDISTLSETFRRHYLAMFDDQDLEVFFDRISSTGVTVCEVLRITKSARLYVSHAAF